ncbi:MAG: winged helix-turn-helix transcriptional regulator [Anaerolineae bacterium]|nr:winged helix-turn-helix transcriptional regulator [Anaerolineae bacterium]
MLNINLLQGQPALKVDFIISLPEILINTLGYITYAPEFEGFDDWIYTTHAALDPEFLDDIKVTLSLIFKSPPLNARLRQFAADDPIRSDFSTFLAWIASLSKSEIQEMMMGTVKETMEREPALEPADLSEESLASFKECLRERLSEANIERVLHYLRTPLEYKAQLISTIARFWEQFYRQEYQESLALAERSVAYYRRQNYGNDAAAIFTAVTGRRVPEILGDIHKVEQLIFIPSCYLGPYVEAYMTDENNRVLVLHYNCRPSSAPTEENTQEAPRIQDIFPPLKALSDETRLQIISLLNGRELYAQEIVDLLDISQSAVSRHLQLMLSSGVLFMRKEESMKYFSINEETLGALATRLQNFRGKPKS